VGDWVRGGRGWEWWTSWEGERRGGGERTELVGRGIGRGRRDGEGMIREKWMANEEYAKRGRGVGGKWKRG